MTKEARLLVFGKHISILREPQSYMQFLQSNNTIMSMDFHMQ